MLLSPCHSSAPADGAYWQIDSLHGQSMSSLHRGGRTTNENFEPCTACLRVRVFACALRSAKQAISGPLFLSSAVSLHDLIYGCVAFDLPYIPDPLFDFPSDCHPNSDPICFSVLHCSQLTDLVYPLDLISTYCFCTLLTTCC